MPSPRPKRDPIKGKVLELFETFAPRTVLQPSEVVRWLPTVASDKVETALRESLTDRSLEVVFAPKHDARATEWTTDLMSLRKVFETEQGPVDGADPRNILVGFRRPQR